MRAIRGRDIGMIFQEPMTALSPVHTVGDQIVEAIRLHERVSRSGGAEPVDRAAAAGRLPGRPTGSMPTLRSSPAECGSAR